MTKIKRIKAREILASGGLPTVEAEVELESGARARASVPYGASAGSHEAVVMFDEDKNRYGGKGMLKAVEIIEKEIGPEVAGMEAEVQKVDQRMIELDGTDNKARLGGNAILAVSMAVARVGAEEKRMPLYEYLQEVYGLERIVKLPKPMVVMIEGGKHADNSTDLQEYLCMPKNNIGAREGIRQMEEVYVELKRVLKENNLSTNVGNEGAFAPEGIANNEKPLQFLTEAIRRAEVEAVLGIDAAASEIFNSSITNYELKTENRKLTAEELIDYYMSWVDKYPIVTMEDMLAEDDWDNWVKLTARAGEKVAIIADDLTATNINRWQKAIEMKAANTILIKLNQAGTVSETIECCKLAKRHGLMTVPSHRGGGETNDTFMTDLAVAVGSEYVKVGPTRGERVEKYNRLMEIEEENDRF